MVILENSFLTFSQWQDAQKLPIASYTVAKLEIGLAQKTLVSLSATLKLWWAGRPLPVVFIRFLLNHIRDRAQYTNATVATVRVVVSGSQR